MNKAVYLGLAILDISIIAIYEFWYDYTKPKFSERAKLCYIDTDSFIAHINTEGIYKDISDSEKRFDTWNYEVDRPVSIEKNEKAVGLMKDKSGGQIMKKTCWITSKNRKLFKRQ